MHLSNSLSYVCTISLLVGGVHGSATSTTSRKTTYEKALRYGGARATNAVDGVATSNNSETNPAQPRRLGEVRDRVAELETLVISMRTEMDALRDKVDQLDPSKNKYCVFKGDGFCQDNTGRAYDWCKSSNPERVMTVEGCESLALNSPTSIGFEIIETTNDPLVDGECVILMEAGTASIGTCPEGFDPYSVSTSDGSGTGPIAFASGDPSIFCHTCGLNVW